MLGILCRGVATSTRYIKWNDTAMTLSCCAAINKSRRRLSCVECYEWIESGNDGKSRNYWLPLMASGHGSLITGRYRPILDRQHHCQRHIKQLLASSLRLLF